MNSTRWVGNRGKGLVSLAVLAFVWGCSSDSDSDVTCGEGTVLKDGQCVVATAGRSGDAGATTEPSGEGGSVRSARGGTSGAEEPGSGGGPVNSGGVSNGGHSGVGGSLPSTGGSAGQSGSGGAAEASGGNGAAGRIVVPVDCGTNLLDGDLGPNNDWIGQEPALVDDNPCGVQGTISIYGDDGLSGCSPSDGASPCSVDEQGRMRCCVAGYTIVDTSYEAWGCALSVQLNASTQEGPILPYAGPAKGFRFELTGTTSGQAIRVGYDQMANPEGTCGPFLGGQDGWTGSPVRGLDAAGSFSTEMAFTDVGCPSGNSCGCTVGHIPYSIAFQVTGAEVAGPFELCLTELVPLAEELPGTGECPAGRTACGDSCCVPPTACTQDGCPAICLPGYEVCGEECMTSADYAYDTQNCGRCGNDCSTSITGPARCWANVCDCITGYALCGDACTDLTSDPNNCGECGRQCPSGYCSVRQCVGGGTGGAGQGGTGQGGTGQGGTGQGGTGRGGGLGSGGSPLGSGGGPGAGGRVGNGGAPSGGGVVDGDGGAPTGGGPSPW